eukprot:TRINITY_DN60378_c0_g2_i1.p1 TRINITY_DN60378_c0_g2~~TRINITY_DN60378_c0_g2_i1.p1  ORF type:complete len:567 (+),score=58.26 TRINITY_DN60378_c0_g2_i1:134-1834(+)
MFSITTRLSSNLNFKRKCFTCSTSKNRLNIQKNLQILCLAQLNYSKIQTTTYQQNQTYKNQQLNNQQNKNTIKKDESKKLEIQNVSDFPRIQNFIKQKSNLIEPSEVTKILSELGEFLRKLHRNKFQQIKGEKVTNLYNIIFNIFENIRIDNFKSNEVSECMWSITIGVQLWGIQHRIQNFEKIFNQLIIQSINCQFNSTFEITNVLWSLSKVFPTSTKSKNAYQTIIAQITENNNFDNNYSDIKLENQNKNNNQQMTFTIDSIVALFESMAIMKFENRIQISYFISIASQLVSDMDSRSVLKFLTAVKQIRYYDQELMSKIENLIINKQWSFAIEKLADVASVFAELGLGDEQVFRVIVQDWFIVKYEGQDLSKIKFGELIYNLAVGHASVAHPQQMIRMVKRYHPNFQTNLINDQLAYIKMASMVCEWQSQDLMLTDRISKAATTALSQKVRGSAMFWSPFKNEVYNYLKKEIVRLKKYVPREKNQVRIDIAVEDIRTKKKVAILAYGEDQYLLNVKWKMLGSAKCQIGMLEVLGWQVVLIRESEWENEVFKLKVVDRIKQLLE